MAQSKSTDSPTEVHHDGAWSPNGRAADVLGFALALSCLRSQIMCSLYKCPSEETINRVCLKCRVDMPLGGILFRGCTLGGVMYLVFTDESDRRESP